MTGGLQNNLQRIGDYFFKKNPYKKIGYSIFFLSYLYFVKINVTGELGDSAFDDSIIASFDSLPLTVLFWGDTIFLVYYLPLSLSAKVFKRLSGINRYLTFAGIPASVLIVLVLLFVFMGMNPYRGEWYGFLFFPMYLIFPSWILFVLGYYFGKTKQSLNFIDKNNEKNI